MLEQAVAVAPQSAASHFALGLFHIRQQRYEAASTAPKTAADLAPADPRYAYTYALALERLGRIPQAITHLQAWQQRHGRHPEVQQVLRKLQR